MHFLKSIALISILYLYLFVKESEGILPLLEIGIPAKINFTSPQSIIINPVGVQLNIGGSANQTNVTQVRTTTTTVKPRPRPKPNPSPTPTIGKLPENIENGDEENKLNEDRNNNEILFNITNSEIKPQINFGHENLVAKSTTGKPTEEDGETRIIVTPRTKLKGGCPPGVVCKSSSSSGVEKPEKKSKQT